ncbi:MAG TPA: tetratricopeptide repeat protein, partial [Pyrinomonadaceae bacterium]|nr:tetratricopeptide repeat protein [Pyrinomonadaceae bacterium]
MIGTTISHYRILGQIGEGGMGVVYVAEDTRLGRRVAVKIPHAGRDERHYRSRFLREARAVSALSHRNIAAVYDYGETPDGSPFIVMELVTGQTLGDILMGPGLTLPRAVEVIEQVAEALAEAHRRGIVHRDIKPSNVIITDRGEVKVLDFGLAKQLDGGNGNGHGAPPSLMASHTRSDVVIGTPLYLSPEQARGAAVDGRSDIFALGGLLYECVAGRPAFSGSNVIEIGAQVLHVNPPPPSEFNPRVPAELDRAALKALAKRPEDRYQTAEEMAADLARVRARLSREDTARTRRLTTDAHIARPSMLITLAESLRRPRFSPLTLLAVAAVLLAGIWLYVRYRTPPVHVPGPQARALHDRGVEALRDGAYYKASGLFKQAVELDPDYALARARYAEAMTEMDSLDTAKDELLHIRTKLVPDRSALPERDRLYLDAVTETAQRHYAEAARAYEGIKRLDPNSPHVHFDLGRAYDKNNETDRAVASYTAATTLDPGYATAYLGLGTLHARLKNLSGATTAFDHAEKLFAAARNDEGRAETHFQRGRLFLELGKIAEARQELERALALAQDTNSLHQQLRVHYQLSYTEAGDQGLGRARGALATARANSMHDLTALGYVTLGNLFTMRSNHAEAEENYNNALDFTGRHKMRRYEALARFSLGSLRERQNRLDEAEQFTRQALEFYEQGGFRKEVASAQMLLGRIQWRRGNLGAALKICEEQLAVAARSNDLSTAGALHRECGDILLHQGRLPRALEHFRESIAVAKALDDRGRVAYGLINHSNMLWQLGRFEEARAGFAELRALVTGPQAVSRELVPRLSVAEARMALALRRFPEAEAAARQALAQAEAIKALTRDTVVEANAIIGMARALSGGGARGLPACQEAARAAEESGDPALISSSQFALAEALLAVGDGA